MTQPRCGQSRDTGSTSTTTRTGPGAASWRSRARAARSRKTRWSPPRSVTCQRCFPLSREKGWGAGPRRSTASFSLATASREEPRRRFRLRGNLVDVLPVEEEVHETAMGRIGRIGALGHLRPIERLVVLRGGGDQCVVLRVERLEQHPSRAHTPPAAPRHLGQTAGRCARRSESREAQAAGPR